VKLKLRAILLRYFFRNVIILHFSSFEKLDIMVTRP